MVAPIVIVGGHMSWPKDYRGLARILGELSGSAVHVARITPMDWVVGHVREYGQLVFEVATAVDRALLESEADRAVLVGHSAGGLLSRVYLGGDAPYGGRRFSGYRRVSRLITLGTPHLATAKGHAPDLIGRLNETFPGAFHPDRVSYLSVAGSAADGKRSQRARKNYEKLAADGRVEGDGVVPAGLALLPGAEHLVLEDVYHAPRCGRWYGGDREAVGRWWPGELSGEKSA